MALVLRNQSKALLLFPTRMARLKLWLRGVGVILMLIGFMSFPLGSSLNPERWTSQFYLFADLGLLSTVGFSLVIGGFFIFGLFFLIRYYIVYFLQFVFLYIYLYYS